MSNGEDGYVEVAGGGSVRWEVVTADDESTKAETMPAGVDSKGRKNAGADKRCRTYFRIVMKAPADPAKRQAFLAQFNVPESEGTVEVRLPIEKVPKQITVKWDADGPRDAKLRSTGS